MTKLLISDFIFFAPGILSALLFNRFASRGIDSKTRFVLESSLFSLFNYVLVFLVSLLSRHLGYVFDAPITLTLSADNKLDLDYSFSLVGWSLVFLFSFLLSILVCLWNKTSWDLKYWGYSPGHNPWDDAFEKAKKKKWHVVVYRKEGDIIYGWPRWISDKKRKKEIFLEDVYMLNTEEEKEKEEKHGFRDLEDHKREGVLLLIEEGDKIEFVASNQEVEEDEQEQKWWQRWKQKWWK